ILIGVVPTAYALNRTPAPSQVEQFISTSNAAAEAIEKKTDNRRVGGDPRPLISTAIALHDVDNNTLPAVGELARKIPPQVKQYGSLAKIPAESVANTRNDMYLASEALRFLLKENKLKFSDAELKSLKAYKASLDDATRFIPLWVKVAVAIALGLGTMIG